MVVTNMGFKIAKWDSRTRSDLSTFTWLAVGWACEGAALRAEWWELIRLGRTNFWARVIPLGHRCRCLPNLMGFHHSPFSLQLIATSSLQSTRWTSIGRKLHQELHFAIFSTIWVISVPNSLKNLNLHIMCMEGRNPSLVSWYFYLMSHQVVKLDSLNLKCISKFLLFALDNAYEKLSYFQLKCHLVQPTTIG